MHAVTAQAAHPLREHGCWDYTIPDARGMEWCQAEDYRLLLDDMQGAQPT